MCVFFNGRRTSAAEAFEPVPRHAAELEPVRLDELRVRRIPATAHRAAARLSDETCAAAAVVAAATPAAVQLANARCGAAKRERSE